MGHCTGLIVFSVLTAALAAPDADRSEAMKEYSRADRAYKKGDYTEAIAALNRCLDRDGKFAPALDLRGSCYFLTGKFGDAVADFDRFLKLRPQEYNGHWRRGIALYYVGKYDEGQKQFEAYEKVEGASTDVENAVWHLMCAARKAGLTRARRRVLNIKNDGRVPMMEVYDLFRGTRKPEEVLKAATAGNPVGRQRKANLFYAHLYLGLYYDLVGQRKKAIEHLVEASGPYKLEGYMGEVARVHREVLEKAKGR